MSHRVLIHQEHKADTVLKFLDTHRTTLRYIEVDNTSDLIIGAIMELPNIIAVKFHSYNEDNFHVLPNNRSIKELHLRGFKNKIAHKIFISKFPNLRTLRIFGDYPNPMHPMQELRSLNVNIRYLKKMYSVKFPCLNYLIISIDDNKDVMNHSARFSYFLENNTTIKCVEMNIADSRILFKCDMALQISEMFQFSKVISIQIMNFTRIIITIGHEEERKNKVRATKVYRELPYIPHKRYR